MKECTAEQFLKDVAGHQMEVLLDQGIHRHLKFRAVGRDSWNQWFEIITWPNSLTISGDMGTWTFSRVEDMFTFFRWDMLKINPYYWSEKLQNGVSGGRSQAKVWDGDVFKAELTCRVKEDFDLKEDQLAELLEAVEDEILGDTDNEGRTMSAVYEFSHKFEVTDDNREPWTLTFEEPPDGQVYCFHFIWCLYAIVWGIQQWDATRLVEVPASVE